MTKSGAVGAMLALVVAGAPLPAQEPARDVRPPTDVAMPVEGCEGGPLAVVAQFLGLAPEQVQAVATALQERQATVEPLLQGIAQRENQIQVLIASGGHPAQIGALTVEIHHLRQAVQAAQAHFLAGFPTLLNDEQRSRWEQVRVAARLQPVVPAFQALQAL